MQQATFLDLEGVAERVGIAYSTVRSYHRDAARRRAEGESRPGDLPKPDEHFGRSPVWRTSTIDDWMASRPGRGVGGGRPRKEPP